MHKRSFTPSIFACILSSSLRSLYIFHNAQSVTSNNPCTSVVQTFFLAINRQAHSECRLRPAIPRGVCAHPIFWRSIARLTAHAGSSQRSHVALPLIPSSQRLTRFPSVFFCNVNSLEARFFFLTFVRRGSEGRSTRRRQSASALIPGIDA